MNHYDAWMIVFVDIINTVKYILPPFIWIIFGTSLVGESFNTNAVIFLIAAVLTYWSYQ